MKRVEAMGLGVASSGSARQGREKLAMTADVIGSGAIRRDDGCLTGAPPLASFARQAVIISNGLTSAAIAARMPHCLCPAVPLDALRNLRAPPPPSLSVSLSASLPVGPFALPLRPLRPFSLGHHPLSPPSPSFSSSPLSSAPVSTRHFVPPTEKEKGNIGAECRGEEYDVVQERVESRENENC
ncbi:hypothetical protein PUN28_014967 [Cardiocondyla obscurior]|uniref:Uncharacterized protein n=1 Tax=Cardiocondyla obscurior TaxID=286306 RepID=A0AAW2EWA0_9HYME